jgi:hypothetical protein
MAKTGLRAFAVIALLAGVRVLGAAVPQPGDWVPMRWPWSDAKSLELLTGGPVNCLLLKTVSAEFVAGASERGIASLALLRTGDVVAQARQAVAAKVAGIVLEGEFPDATIAGVKEAAGSTPVILITARTRMPLGGGAPIVATYQGVWPGISVMDDRAKKSGPTGSTWIDTNTGFIRTVRARGEKMLWLANEPPANTVVTGARYQQVVADAEMSGARWVIALDADFTKRLGAREADALSDWRRIVTVERYFEDHPEWRSMPEYGKLALVQETGKGGLLSGGILDMIAVKHTPVKAIPRQELSAQALSGATMAVNADGEALSPEQREILRGFTRAGGTLLTGPPGWKDPSANDQKITLDKDELERLNDIWRDVNSMIGRRNLGVRLFNVASMLSNLVAPDDGKTAVLHLVNYADYPVEGIAVHFIGKYKRATLTTPDGASKNLEIYETEDGGGVDIDKVSVVATLKLEQ